MTNNTMPNRWPLIVGFMVFILLVGSGIVLGYELWRTRVNSETFAGSVCSHYVDPPKNNETKVVDGKKYSGLRPNAKVKKTASLDPGDTICINQGSYRSFLFQNITGEAGKPVVITNYGGKVVLRLSVDDFAIELYNSKHVRLDGRGNAADKYGFVVDGKREGTTNRYTSGLSIARKSSYIEVNNIEVGYVNAAGIYAKTDAVCTDGTKMPHSYDYDGDGKKGDDKDDVVNQSRFTQETVSLHDSYIHHTGDEGVYIGSSFYKIGRTVTCTSGTEKVFDPIVKGVLVYNNRFENLGWDGIQVGSAIANCSIYNNTILNDSQKKAQGQMSGIMNNRGSVCAIFNNRISKGLGYGIYIQGNGGNKVYNNIIVDQGSATYSGIVTATGSNTSGSVFIVNNTIIKPYANGINFHNEKGTGHKIQNNVIVSPQKSSAISYGGRKNVVVSNNYTTNDIRQVRFVNPSVNDYHLQKDSPLIDAGLTLADQQLSTDFEGRKRPRAKAFDIGAFEF